MFSRKEDSVHAYWLLGELGLSDHTYTHLSVRAEGEDAFYIHPFGLRFEEVTYENMLKVDFHGNVIEGEEALPNPVGYQVHLSVYQHRSDLNAVFHLHTPATVAVSAMKQGLLPLSQWSLHFYGQVAYHNYNSLALVEDEGSAMAHSLGDKSVMLMRHHGSLTAGKTVAEAMFYMHHLELACQAQCQAMAAGDDLLPIDPDVCKQSVRDLLGFEADLGRRDWQAWLRFLARRGYHVGQKQVAL